MAEKLIKPSLVFIGNKNKHDQPFPIYKQNINFNLKPGQSVRFPVERANELFYYDQLEVKGLEVGLVDPIHYAQIGHYVLGTETFTEGNTTYSIVGNGTDYKILGTIPFEAADASLGLAKGNRITLRITSDIPKNDLPSGKIIKTTNTGIPGGYNEYTKAAAEDDGSIVNISNVTGKYLLEIKVKWIDDEDFVTYTFDTSEAIFEAE